MPKKRPEKNLGKREQERRQNQSQRARWQKMSNEVTTLQAQLDQLTSEITTCRREIGIADHPFIDAINQLNYQMKVLLGQIFPDPTDLLKFHIYVEETKLQELADIPEKLKAIQEETERQARMAALVDGIGPDNSIRGHDWTGPMP